MDGQNHFQLIVPDGAFTPDVLGLWDIVPAATSFAPDSEQTESLRWWVNLPANLQAAMMAVDGQLLLLHQEGYTLNQQALQRFEAALYAVGKSASFAPDIAQPERELVTWLQMMGGGQSLWPGEDLLKDWWETAKQTRAFIEQVQRSLAYYAWVETSVAGEYLGRTAIHWQGDVTTEWRAGLGTQQVMLHQRVVTLAIESRTTWVRVFLMAIRGAVMLSAALGTPGGMLLSLPMAIKFICQMLAELRQDQ